MDTRSTATLSETALGVKLRVAVVAVHGVADQQPGETAAAIAGLLANLQSLEGRPAYAPFARRSVRIPVRRLDVPPHAAAGHTFARRARALRDSPSDAAPDVGFEFMTTVLAPYEIDGPEDTFDTTVQSSERADAPSAPAVDVYEMYWADLSRLTQSVLRIFTETYQLLFHLGSLGVHAVSAAQVVEKGIGTSRRWSWWASCQRLAANAVALGALVLNLVLVAIALMLVAQSWLRPYAAAASMAIAGLLLAAGLGGLTYGRYARAARQWPLALVALFVGAGLAALAVRAGPPRSAHAIEAVLATQLWFLAAAGVGAIARLYDRHRPGAAIVAAALGAPLSARLLFTLWQPGTESAVAAMLDAGAIACAAMAGAWIVFFAAGWTAFVLGRSLTFDASRQARRSPPGSASRDAARDSADRIRRAEWTARITLTIPAALFVVVTTVLWWAFWSVGGKQMTEPVRLTPLLTYFTSFLVNTSGTAFRTPAGLMSAVIDTSAGWGFGVLMLCVAAAGVLGLYALAPSVLNEVKPPARTLDGTPLGRWLDDGFRYWRLGGHLIWIGTLVVLPSGLIALTRLSQADATAWVGFNIMMLTYASALVVPAGAGLMTFGNRFKSLTLGLRNVIDAALDVDNHLREHPIGKAPRARIAARYASLLRYLYRQGYDKIVVIAHSQGAVITADLLRYVTTVARGPHAAIVADIRARPECPIELFTMGAPLRQLYGLRFPHLYRWARNENPGPCQPEMPIAATAAPDPAALGIARWVNAYRSGDYIGRYLWRPDGCVYAYSGVDRDVHQPWNPSAEPMPAASVDGDPPTRTEFCIGSGAHTHYWDRTAPAIAIELDRLIHAGRVEVGE